MKKISLIYYILIKKIYERKSFLLIIISVAAISSYSCKDENDIGTNLLAPGDELYTFFTDTATVQSSTKRDDSLRTDEVELQLLGSDKDPVFGLTTSSIYTQVNLTGTPVFGTSPIADSLVLILSYSGSYGDTNTAQAANVYRLSESMYTDSAYFSERTFDTIPGTIGSINFSPKPKTSVVVGTDILSPQIRIKLSQQTADEIISLSGSSTLASNAEWVAYFKGLLIDALPVATPGAISYFNFFNSKLTLYYRNTTDTNTYDFSLTGARINHFSHDYTGTAIQMQLDNIATAGDSINYVQAMGGVKLKISFPFLKHFLDSGSILVNRAELKIEAQTSTTPLPESMLLFSIDNDGKLAYPIDYFESAGYYGGILSGNLYTFNIARQLQRYLNGVVTNGDFYLVAAGSYKEANRAIIRSGTNQFSRMKLSLHYTKLN